VNVVNLTFSKNIEQSPENKNYDWLSFREMI